MSDGETNEDIETMLQFQSDSIAKMNRNLTNFKKEPVFSKSRLDRLNTRLETYQKEYDLFMYYHRKLLLSATTKDKENVYFCEFHIDMFESAYCDAVAEVKEQVTKVSQPMSSISDSAHNQSFAIDHQHTDVRLPPIPLPTFSGDYIEWPAYADQFTASVHKNKTLTNANRLTFLKGTLTGDAAALISGLTTTDANYSVAWDMLKERYECKRIIFNHAMSMILNIDTINRESTTLFKSMIGIADTALKSLESVGIDKSLISCIVAFILTQKLPIETITFLEQSVASQDEITTYAELKRCVNIRIRSLDVVMESQMKRNSDSGNNSKPNNNKSSYQKKSVNSFHFAAKPNSSQGPHSSNTNNGTVIACKLCSENHSIRICSKFLAMPSNEREITVERFRLCRNCLSNTHFIAQCSSKRNCRECGSRHHTLIHPYHRKSNMPTEWNSQTVSNDNERTNTKQSNNSGNVMHSNHTINVHSFRQVLLATAIVKVQGNSGEWIPLRALLDQGGDGCTITEAASQLLHLPINRQSVEIKPLGGGAPLISHKLVELNIKSVYNNAFKVTAPAVVLNTLTDTLPASYIKVEKWPHINGLQLADPEFFKPTKIDLVLGADVYYCALMDGLLKGPMGTPMAQQTKLGWILSGPIATANSITNSLRINHVSIDFNEAIQRFFQIESVPEVKAQSKADAYCEEFFHSTIKRDDEGRFVLKLPFKTPNEESAVLGKSKAVALQQFLRLERRLASNARFREEYTKGMEDYIEQKHMQLTTNTEEDCECTTPRGDSYFQSYYIPHHAVIKEGSTTTKLRNVFNASQKTSNGNSLNDILYPGPVKLADLTAVLINWRCHRIAYMADIAKMYRQIRIDESDITYQRIFWRNHPNETIKEYCLNRLTFGTNFAPSFAIMSVQHLSRLERENYPNGAEVIEKDTYMDDTMSGNATIELALRDQREAINILNSAGMELRKWASNSNVLIEAVPECQREMTVPLSLDGDESIKALGTFWNTSTDVFDFRVNIDDTKDSYTKRSIMSTICKLFDPLGLVSPVVAKAKMLMKEIWRTECDWDDTVSTELDVKWRKYLSELKSIKFIKVSRWIGYLPNVYSIQLHGFCDASMQAYGAVIYLRVIDEANEIRTHLIISKSKVAPMTSPTIPRLELCGAVVLARLMQYVIKSMRHFHVKPTDVKLWTDSQTVLQWLRSDPSRWDVFVANRAMEIHKSTEVEQWQHVRTFDNPADLISRGASPEELQASNLWWFGPNWLQLTESDWPIPKIVEAEPIEERRVRRVYTFTISQTEYLERFSTLRKLIRSTAWFHRLFAILSKVVTRFKGSLIAAELSRATMFWVKVVQLQAFSQEIESLTDKNKTLQANRLNNLHPFIDKEGIMRVGGRLKNSDLSFNEKHPIILPNKHHFTKLVILSAHLQTLHGATQLTMSHVRKTYWIVNARKTIASTIHRCITCHRQRAKFTEQLMADLPAARVRISKPFTHVGVDFCGPFQVRASKGRGIKANKAWVAVFVCLCVKAIHLELVSDLSTEAFLAAFRRFISRRGLPTCMYSDCGTNFIGAIRVIKQKQNEYDAFITQTTITALTNENIEWKFNPPASPHFGGLFEAGVKSTKFHLKRVLGNANLTFEEFYTVLTQIEACLNSRPLVPQTNDPNDLTVITPGHFLTGDSLLALPEPSIEKEIVAIGQRFRYCRKLRDEFWTQWSTDYLSRLQNRPKWQKPSENLKVNDVVLVRDERLPPSKWALARILATHPGSDGLVRVATIKTSTGEYKRPVAKLSLLPIYENTIV